MTIGHDAKSVASSADSPIDGDNIGLFLSQGNLYHPPTRLLCGINGGHLNVTEDEHEAGAECQSSLCFVLSHAHD